MTTLYLPSTVFAILIHHTLSHTVRIRALYTLHRLAYCYRSVRCTTHSSLIFICSNQCASVFFILVSNS